MKLPRERFDAGEVAHSTHAAHAAPAIDGAQASADVTAPTADELVREIELPASMQSLLGPGEIVILVLKPSLLYIVLSSLGTLLACAIISLLLAYSAQFAWSPWSDTAAVSIGVIVSALRLARATFDWWGHVYVLTDRRVIACRGIIRTVMQETPLSRLQNTIVVQSMRERLCGLGTIGFATAGRGTFDAFWESVVAPFAVHRTVLDAVERYGRR